MTQNNGMYSQGFKFFRSVIEQYYRQNARHDLPWRKTDDPYCILVSEIMLQQTQVSRVEKKYHEFIAQFPDVSSLAHALNSDILAVWSGLGYNRRALYLKKTAEEIVKRFDGKIPEHQEILSTLPGIGKNTAGAIIAFSFNKPVVFIETNIRRVFIHFFFKEQSKISDRQILDLVEKTMDTDSPRIWYWALMDYGSYLASLKENPNRRSRHYTKQSKFEGSDRKIRGEIIRILLKFKKVPRLELMKKINQDEIRLNKILRDLEHEGFIKTLGQIYVLK